MINFDRIKVLTSLSETNMATINELIECDQRDYQHPLAVRSPMK